MKLSTYIVTVDAGFSPNPFGRHCTLACCKPTIRRNAQSGDIVVGIASSHSPTPRKLIYAMRVREVLTYQEYWENSRFQYRRPTTASRISRCGDNIWHRDKGKWKVAKSDYHDQSHKKRDTRGKNVLIATDFFYFGREAIEIAPRFQHLMASTRGHKNSHDEGEIKRLWSWISRRAKKHGRRRIALPTDFNEEGCKAQCLDVEGDDLEEC